MRRILLVLFFFCCSSHFAIAQDHRRELLKLIQQYTGTEEFISTDMFIAYYPYRNSSTPIDTITIHLELQGINFYYTLGDHEYLRNKRFSIAVNKSEKLILLNKSASAAMPLFSIQQLDSLLSNNAATVQSLGNNAGCKGYRILFESGEIESEECWFALKDSKPSKIILCYKKTNYEDQVHEPRVEIQYHHVRIVHLNMVDAAFSEGKYLSDTGKNPKPAIAFKEYKVINNIQ